MLVMGAAASGWSSVGGAVSTQAEAPSERTTTGLDRSCCPGIGAAVEIHGGWAVVMSLSCEQGREMVRSSGVGTRDVGQQSFQDGVAQYTPRATGLCQIV